MHTAQNSLQPNLHAVLWLPRDVCLFHLNWKDYDWCPLLVVPATRPVLLATRLVSMMILEKVQETIAHHAVCIIVHGMLSPCRITDRMSSTSWYWVGVSKTFPELSQVILCLEGPGPMLHCLWWRICFWKCWTSVCWSRDVVRQGHQCRWECTPAGMLSWFWSQGHLTYTLS